jgi:lysophospholipase L1-like esterase
MTAKILFVGDSITHGTNWSAEIDFAEVENIAVPGYSTDDVLQQLESIDLNSYQVISLLVGTNDFGNIALDRAGDDVGRRVSEVINQILNRSENSRIVVNSILPRDLRFTERIQSANKMISAYSHERVSYLDCWSALANENYLRPEFLLDDGFDVHLSDSGYQAWAAILLPVLKHSLI